MFSFLFFNIFPNILADLSYFVFIIVFNCFSFCKFSIIEGGAGVGNRIPSNSNTNSGITITINNEEVFLKQTIIKESPIVIKMVDNTVSNNNLLSQWNLSPEGCKQSYSAFNFESNSYPAPQPQSNPSSQSSVSYYVNGKPVSSGDYQNAYKVSTSFADTKLD